ncbi:MAG: OmpA-OmpF porin, family [Acetobacteraceae bacterium]|jgi:OOP family OmpA-OmpF porin|nr:OmpA-OmpF porin, family [Acetobacteraceae bacterium]
MKFRNALVAATILALPVAAKAQPISGLYIGGAAGVNIMQDEHARISAGTATRSGDLQTDLGPAVALSLGYGLGNGLRAEIEGDYRYNTFSGASGGLSRAGGQEQKFGVMANVLYDFYGLTPYVVPYVGVGAGYMWAQDRNLHVSSGATTATAATDTEGKFAYQAIIGASLPIAGAPGLSLTADYRFMGMVGDRNYSGAVGALPANFKLNDDYNHTVLVGFRYAFGVAPAPAPAPVAAAVPPSPVSRSYLVFFDWDKSNLTDRARQIVSEAAANSTKVQYTRLEVNGYTDTSGTPQYNQGLSVRRAQAVAAELVKDGVPKSAISIQGFGETHLLVPTGAGVREPQNRRVEIIIK